MSGRRDRHGTVNRSIVHLSLPPDQARQAIVEAARGCRGVLFVHVSDRHVGLFLGRTWTSWGEHVDALIVTDQQGTHVRVSSRMDLPARRVPARLAYRKNAENVSRIVAALKAADGRREPNGR